ncbi:MAG: DEAD/DEAH box helicase family protein [candidate division WOR-3 bacterium]|uniref:Helicase/UvrB N-terminal domain-containing protein n=2 Tax=candidate division WOR-3 bacterium TaxID=2052148 RepID=A0A7C3EL47_UNCW3|nr:DEAD/DEAH box helicase family protein [candidate division WOR-3 bacterium]
MAQPPRTWIQYDKTLPYIEDRDPSSKPASHLVNDGENSYKVVEGRRPSRMLLVNKLRSEVDRWRDEDYPGITETTRELLYFWFFNDHMINGELFRYWFCQREAVETLIYLFEVRKFDDLEPVIRNYAENFRKDLFQNAVEFAEDLQGRRKIIRYFPELQQQGEQDLPEKGLLRYAFKMATGTGKTYAMALIIVWSYFNRLREKDKRYPDNFLIIAPNVIVYERLAKDFVDSRIFYNLPLIPPAWRPNWQIRVTLREDDSPLNPSGNLIVNNIQQLYESRSADFSPENILEEILGEAPQKDLTKSSETLTDRIKKLSSLMVINDEAHHVHDEELKWHQTLMSIHNSLPGGVNLWLDFSATPKTQTGTYYPWIIVDYPLAQAVEDRIVKVPLIVHRVDRKDPEDITRDNVIQKYGDWISAALERWREHYKTYSAVGKKPVLFIMAERNDYADQIAMAIRKRKDLGFRSPDKEVIVIHVKSREGAAAETEIKISEKDLPVLRQLVRQVDEPDNEVKIIVSNLMLREGWDVQNVTIVLGLRPFTSKAEILPEQAIGRGLRLMRGVSPAHTQTLEVIGTQAFEAFVRELEKEGVGINTVKIPPPLPIIISHERSRLEYDIAIPQTEPSLVRNYKKLEELDPQKIPPVYNSDKLDETKKILLKMEFPFTMTEVHKAVIVPEIYPAGRELVAYITKEVRKRARIACDFNVLYPIIERYILERCFETKIRDIEDVRLRKNLNDISVQEAIVDTLAKELGMISVETRKAATGITKIRLSEFPDFTWRRKHVRCKKTVFNFVAVYNNYEEEFAKFLDRCPDISRFAALANLFSVDYLSSRGAIRLYFPDFVAVQTGNGKEVHWIIETRGREYEDAEQKDKAIKTWCERISTLTGCDWKFIKIYQSEFEEFKREYEGKIPEFSDLVQRIIS